MTVTPETYAAVVKVLEHQREDLATLKAKCGAALGLAVCAACGCMMPREELVGHARAYSDVKHAVVEVMLA